MNNEDMARPWEDAIRAAVRVRDADPGFTRRLRGELMRKTVKEIPIRRKPAFRPAWAATMIVIAVLLGAFLVIGPEKVVAALQSLFGYVPDAGFLRMDQPFRILEREIKEERSGATLYIRQVLADGGRTVVVYEVDCPGPETQWLKTSTYCTDAPSLRLPGGARLEALGLSGRSGLPYYRERAEYAALPSDAVSVALILPFRAKPGDPAWPWTVEIPLTSTAQSATVYPVWEVTPAVPAAGTEDPLGQGIRFTVDRIVAMEENYLLEGSLEWDPARYASAAPDYTQLEIADGNGELCAWEKVLPDSVSGGAGNWAAWAVRFNPRGRPGPFTVSAKSMIVERPASASFEMDFGPAPFIGQTWALDIPIRAAGYALRVTSAWIDGNNGTVFVFFSFAGERNAVAAGWEDADQQTTPIGMDGLEGFSIFDIGAEYGHMPVGRHTIRVLSIRLMLSGEWTVRLEGIPAE